MAEVKFSLLVLVFAMIFNTSPGEPSEQKRFAINAKSVEFPGTGPQVHPPCSLTLAYLVKFLTWIKLSQCYLRKSF